MATIGRHSMPKVKINQQDASTVLDDYIESVEYTDVASGAADTLSLTVHNIDWKWLKNLKPKKGDTMDCDIWFYDWKEDGDNRRLKCGHFLLDKASMQGGPLQATLEGIAAPLNSDFKARERTKTWKNVTTKQIAASIAGSYGMALTFDADPYTIASLEQSEKSDSEFLYSLCQDYGYGMKAFDNKLIIWSRSKYEEKAPSATIDRNEFIDDSWKFEDALDGTYTGARVSYKKAKANKDVSVYLGIKGEHDKGARVMKVNETCDSEAEARAKGAAKVNEENTKQTTLTGEIFARPEIVAGITVQVTGLELASGKYFVDQVKTTVSDGGTRQELEMHRCVKQIK